MVGHLAIGMATQGIALHDISEESQKPVSVYVVKIDARPAHSAGRDVIGESCCLNAERPCHGAAVIHETGQQLTGELTQQCAWKVRKMAHRDG